MARAAGTTWITGFVLAACAALAPVPAVARADLDKAGITTWLEGRVAESQTDWYVPGLRVQCVLEEPIRVTAAAAADLTEAVKGRPDHPGHAALREYAWEQAHGPANARHVFWMAGPGAWRWNTDFESATGKSFADNGCSGEDLWTLTANQINIRAAGAAQGAWTTSDGKVMSARAVLHLIWFSGLYSSSHDGDSHVSDVEVQGTSWRASVALQGGIEVRVEGVERESAPVVTSVRIVRAANTDWVGVRWQFSNWLRGPDAVAWLAGQCDEFDPQGRMRRRIRDVRFAVVSEAEVARLVAVPSVGRPDIVRGQLTSVQTVNDWRAGRFETLARQPDGTFSASALHDVAGLTRAWQWIGWVIGSTILLVFLLCRWGRRA